MDKADLDKRRLNFLPSEEDKEWRQCGFKTPKNSLLHSLAPKRVEKYTKAPERAEFELDPPLFLQVSTLFYPRHRFRSSLFSLEIPLW